MISPGESITAINKISSEKIIHSLLKYSPFDLEPAQYFNIQSKKEFFKQIFPDIYMEKITAHIIGK